MKLAISNIAWPVSEDAAVRDLIVELGIDGIEVAPTLLWHDPLLASTEEILEYRATWEERGVPIVAMQALLFGHPELQLFESEVGRSAMLERLQGMARVGGLLGAGPLVYGSPKNRRRGELAPERAMAIAETFFRAAGQAAEDQGTRIVIEPNPPQYDCDFATDAATALELVRRVDHPGFGLHLDTAGMTLAGDPPAPTIAVCAEAIEHFHASEAMLAPLGDSLLDQPKVDHGTCGRALHAVGYSGIVSLEMRRPEGRPLLAELRRALTELREYYRPNSE